jgi:hypothetical protein
VNFRIGESGDTHATQEIVRTLAFLFSLLGLLATHLRAQELQAAPGAAARSPVRLLPGYKIELRHGFEGDFGGRIWKPGGLSVDFDSGIHNPKAIDSIEAKDVGWRIDQILDGHHVVLVYGVSGRVAISILDRAANFSAMIRNQQDLAEMLLMAVTFEPGQGYPVDSSAIVTPKAKPK